MDASLFATVLGLLASVAGLAVAFVQSIRLRELKRRTYAEIWQAVSTTQSALRSLEHTTTVNSDVSVAKAYAKTAEIFKYLLRQAALAERDFSEVTIARWIDEQKIQGEWQIAQARKIIFGKDSKHASRAKLAPRAK